MEKVGAGRRGNAHAHEVWRAGSLSLSPALPAASRRGCPFCQLRGRVGALQPDGEAGRGGAQLCSRTGRVTESTVPRAGAASGKPLTSSRGTRRVGRPHHKGSLCASAGPALGWPSPAHSALAAVPGVGTVLNPVHRGEPGPGGGPGLPETSQPMKGELGSGVQEEPLSALYCTPNPSWPQPCTVPQPHQCLQR